MAKFSIRHSLPLFVFVVVVGFLYKGLVLDNTAEAAAPKGKQVPAFKLGTLEDPGKMVSESIFKGKVTVLNAWASWCIPCREDHRIMVDLSKSGVNVVSLILRDDAKKAKAWLAQRGNPYSVNLLDPKAQLGASLGIRGTPTVLIIDKQGIIRYRHVGIISDEMVEKEIKPMLNKLK